MVIIRQAISMLMAQTEDSILVCMASKMTDSQMCHKNIGNMEINVLS